MARKSNPRLKGANELTEMTPENLQEFRKCANDIIYFCKTYVKIQHPVQGSVPFRLYPYQEKMMRMYNDERYTIILSARQTGKALALDTEIPTPQGWSTMGELKVGDFALGADGHPVEIIETSQVMTDRPCYKLTFDTGDVVIADENHLWDVNDESTNSELTLTTKQMFSGGYATQENNERYTINTTSPLNLKAKHLPKDPYNLGVSLASGIDIPIIPIDYLRSCFTQRLELLQGLMDVSGSVDGEGQCDITLMDKRLAEGSYELIASLGLKPSIQRLVVNGVDQWELKFVAYSKQIETFKLPEKLRNMREYPPEAANSTSKRSIQKLELVDSVPVKCISVNNADQLFLFGRGMIPTHNSICSAIYLLWYGMFHFDKTILISSNKNAGAMEMIHRIRFAYEELPGWLKPGVTDDGWNKHNIGFDNGSRIVSTATSEDAGRGMAISLLFLDEFAFVQPNIQEEFWTSISPTLSTGGSCIMTSTPNGDSNLFAHMWRAAQVGGTVGADEQNIGFMPLQVKWDEPPGRDEKFKAEQIAILGELKWAQEYECLKIDTKLNLIDTDGREFTATLEELTEMLSE